MHRPGIASVQGDRIVLDGTTIEELERYHLSTLKLVVSQLNDEIELHLRSERERRERDAREAFEHDRRVQETAKRMRFDED